MKVFSLNRKNKFEFWGAFTPEMIERFTKGEAAEWLTVACESMLGFSGKSYLEEKYDWFVSPDADPEEKMNLIGSFIGGCIKINDNNKKKILGIIDSTEEDTEANGKTQNCVSDVVLKITAEDVYKEVMDNITLEKDVAELEDMREYILDVEGVDIYLFMLHAIARLRGSNLVKNTAIVRLREVIKKYNLTDLIKSALSCKGTVEYIESKVANTACAC